MGHGVHGSQLAGRKRSAQMDIKPDTATVTVLPRLTVGVNAVEVVARGSTATNVKTATEDVNIYVLTILVLTAVDVIPVMSFTPERDVDVSDSWFFGEMLLNNILTVTQFRAGNWRVLRGLLC